jgi:hypothetical protein
LDLIRAGRVEVTAMYLNFTELLDLNALIRSCYPAARLQDKHGIPIRSAMCSDINGLPWGFAKVLPAVGVSYLNVASNPTRALPRNPPRFFWWEAADGQRMLVWDGPSYFLANLLGFGHRSEPFAEGLTAYLGELEADNYPYDAIGLRVQGVLGDNSPPTLDICEQVQKWNSKAKSPCLELCTNSQWFDFANSNFDLSRIQVIHGAWPDWWSDGLGSTPQLDSQVRTSLRQLKLLAPRARPPKASAIWDPIIEDILFAAEHTFGASASVSNPSASPSKSQWDFKRSFAERAFRETAAGERHADEWEPAACLAWIEVDRANAFFETPLYSLRLSAETGAITDLIDRELGWQVAAPGEFADFNGLVLETISSANGRRALWDDDQGGTETHHEYWVENRHKSRVRRDTRFDRSAARLHTIRTARDADRLWIVSDLHLDTFDRVQSIVTVWLNTKRIDLTHHLVRERRRDGPNATYISFPVATSAPRFGLHSPGGAFEPGKQQVPLSATDFYAIDDWLSVGDDRVSLYWVSLDAPLVQLGAIRTGKWGPALNIANGHFYSWPTNNYWYTNFVASQHGHLLFRYSFTTQSGPPSGASAEEFSRWVTGESKIDRLSPLTVDSRTIVIREVKRAENNSGWIVRLEEVDGKPCRTQVRAKQAGAELSAVDPCERRLADEKRVNEMIEFRPFEMKTIEIADI